MSENIRIAKRLVAILPIAIFAIAFVGASPAAIATSSANCTPTNCNLHGITMDLGSTLGANPCTGQPVTDAVLTGNLASHASTDQTHVTGTIDGQLTLIQGNGVTYSGHFKSWFGGNINSGGAAEMSGTDNANLVGSDGTSFHLTDHSHITITPNGVVTVQVFALNCH